MNLEKTPCERRQTQKMAPYVTCKKYPQQRFQRQHADHWLPGRDLGAAAEGAGCSFEVMKFL